MATGQEEYLRALDWIVMCAAGVCLVVVMVLLRRYPPAPGTGVPAEGGD